MGDNKKVHNVELMPSEQLLAVISGRNRHVRLVPMVGFDGRDTDSFKLLETKGCQLLAWGKPRPGAYTCLCVAMKRQVICYELNKSKPRHQRLREIQVRAITRRFTGTIYRGRLTLPTILCGRSTHDKVLNCNVKSKDISLKCLYLKVF